MSADGGNPNHHLWNNHGTWWVHATVLRGGVVQERIRRSLRTRDPFEARRLRDELLAELASSADPRLSFRIGRPRPSRQPPQERKEVKKSE